jgi:hypothetical protein
MSKIPQTVYRILTPKEYRKVIDADFAKEIENVKLQLADPAGNPAAHVINMNTIYTLAYAMFRTSTAYSIQDLKNMLLQVTTAQEAVKQHITAQQTNKEVITGATTQFVEGSR